MDLLRYSLNPENQYVLPPPLRATQSNNAVGKIIIGVALVVLILLCFGGYALFKSTTSSTAGAKIAANQLLVLLKEHKFVAAKALLTPAAQSVTSVSEISSLFLSSEQANGNLISWGTPAWFVQYYNGASYVQLTYPLTYAHGEGSVVIVEQPTGSGSYGVRSFNMQL